MADGRRRRECDAERGAVVEPLLNSARRRPKAPATAKGPGLLARPPGRKRPGRVRGRRRHSATPGTRT
eukprot:3721223-Alexandrium_andersonii.AAC.1